jgi:hypothetical protein
MALVRILKGRVNSGFWRSAVCRLFLVGSHQCPIEVTYRIYRHLMPSAWDRARTALDQAYLEALADSQPDLARGG